MAGTLVFSAALGLAIAGIYLGAAGMLARRAAARRGLWLFALFWAGIGVYAAADSGWALLMALFDPPLAVGIVALELKILGGVAGFFGLVGYLLLVYTGRAGAVVAAGCYHVALFLLVEYHYQRRSPIGQREGVWGAALEYANPQDGLWTAMTLALFVPPVLAAAAYAALARVAPPGPLRWRIVFTSLALVGFFASMTLGWLHGRWPWWGLTERLLALGLASCVLLAASLPDGPAPAAAAAPQAS